MLLESLNFNNDLARLQLWNFDNWMILNSLKTKSLVFTCSVSSRRTIHRLQSSILFNIDSNVNYSLFRCYFLKILCHADTFKVNYATLILH